METTLSFENAKKLSYRSDDSLRGVALFKVIFGIMAELDLSQEELAIMVGRSPTTISEWKKKEVIPISKKLDMNDYQLFEFIDLYKVLTNLFVLQSDRTSWLRDNNEGLGGQSPLGLIKTNPKNLYSIKDLVSRIANP